MGEYICQAKKCKNLSEVVVCRVDLCDECYSSITKKCHDKTGSKIASESPVWLNHFARFLKADEAEYVKSVADSIKETPPNKEPIVTEQIKKPKLVKKASSGDQLVRRAPAIDEIGDKLLACDGIDEMLAVAGSIPGINREKLATAKTAFEGGTQPGLVRMRLGNLMRGAIRRNEREDRNRDTEG